MNDLENWFNRVLDKHHGNVVGDIDYDESMMDGIPYYEPETKQNSDPD